MFVSFALFTSQIVVYRFTIMFLYPSLKSNLNIISDICIKFSLVTLRICKSHFFLILIHVLQSVLYNISIWPYTSYIYIYIYNLYIYIYIYKSTLNLLRKIIYLFYKVYIKLCIYIKYKFINILGIRDL